eukprot:TRINITY_DN15038_c0_g1_i2.p1 TRINITY_DN15038_c0_g1~~TRINITY_DN15038_c0_g1_i2.p1  ORF type:complete len:175 (+),score=36.57 TRINITY_DN15038_c0_g1_i2:153-677(+)
MQPRIPIDQFFISQNTGLPPESFQVIRSILSSVRNSNVKPQMDYNTVSNALSSALNNLGNRGNVGIGSDPLVEEAMRLSLQTSQQEERKYEELENQLVSRGLKILTVPNDGNCLFHAVALQELGSIEFHSDLRANVISFMRNNKDRFVHFVTSNWENYLATMSCNGEYGTNLGI